MPISEIAHNTNKKEIKNPVKAIRAFCLECLGTYEEIKVCSATKCPLYLFRFGKNPYRAERIITEEQRQAASDRFAKIRAEKQKDVS